MNSNKSICVYLASVDILHSLTGRNDTGRIVITNMDEQWSNKLNTSAIF